MICLSVEALVGCNQGVKVRKPGGDTVKGANTSIYGVLVHAEVYT